MLRIATRSALFVPGLALVLACGDSSGVTDRGPMDEIPDTTTEVSHIEAAVSHTCALTRTNAAYCWGEGVLTDSGSTGAVVPTPVPVAGSLAFPEGPP